MGPSFDSFLLELRIFSGDAAKQMFCLNITDFAELGYFSPPYSPVFLHVLDDHLFLLERFESIRPYIFRLHMESFVERCRQMIHPPAPFSPCFHEPELMQVFKNPATLSHSFLDQFPGGWRINPPVIIQLVYDKQIIERECKRKMIRSSLLSTVVSFSPLVEEDHASPKPVKAYPPFTPPQVHPPPTKGRWGAGHARPAEQVHPPPKDPRRSRM